MNPSGARIVDMTIWFCDRLAELIIGSAHLPQALRRTPATQCAPQGAQRARAPTTANLKPRGRPT